MLGIMKTTTSTKIGYRKTKAGVWVVCGPCTVVKAGATVTVTKADGTTKYEHIASVGKPFDGLCYGYLTPDPDSDSSCDNCGEGRGTVRKTDSSGLTGKVCRGCANEPSFALSFG
jgi:hypothetical protein